MKIGLIVTKFSAILILMILISGCSSFETQECGNNYIHVSYGDGLTGFRVVTLNESSRMGFSIRGTNDWSKWTNYKNDSNPKVTFEHQNNTIAVSCGSQIKIITSIPPTINSMNQNVSVVLVEAAELIDSNSYTYDFLIRGIGIETP